ncbi:septum site-determining protein MinC [Enterobacteriaceae endosymbiont of Macroplea appendiculata]|uniref:septum site-determining protein MinC n=1 Tax=Enterobacteriaceae endosymbiont of Macroplea appendiculata TaxID=2675790 RepID=UPI0014495F3F|nr:septum site-determining protein MinC [Enterobacteriaceae endosymbiont of Macroplea appendiculata]QJC30740.1 septum site-determining protein MinC [Enterobacteriaceae endosymbiont of Macroplea appendiculata]
MSTEIIKFKQDNFIFYVIYLYHVQPKNIYQAVKNKIKTSIDLFTKIPVIINISLVTLQEKDWPKIYEAILKTGINIIGVSGCHDINIIKIISRTGIPIIYQYNNIISNTNYIKPKKQLIKTQNSQTLESLIQIIKYKKKTSNINFTNSKIIDYHIRSGQQIYARNCDLIIINHVSHGAELISDGNIHIYGYMRGKALSGANGNQNCQIFCSKLFAELLSIAGEFLIKDNITNEFLGQATRIFLKNKKVTIQLLNIKKNI